MFIKFIYLMLFCAFGASTIVTKDIIHIYNTISLHLTPYSTGSTNHVFGIPTKDVKQAMGLENILTIFVQAKIHGITSATVNPEDMLDNTRS